MVRIAFYKGPAKEFLHKLGHFGTKLFTGSKYSHCELILGGWCYSSSSRDGGVRKKAIDYGLPKWDVYDLPSFSEDEALAWFEFHQGQAYDWAGIWRFVFPFLPQKQTSWFCSEACAAALGLERPEDWSPQDLYAYLKWDNEQHV